MPFYAHPWINVISWLWIFIYINILLLSKMFTKSILVWTNGITIYYTADHVQMGNHFLISIAHSTPLYNIALNLVNSFNGNMTFTSELQFSKSKSPDIYVLKFNTPTCKHLEIPSNLAAKHNISCILLTLWNKILHRL